MNTTTLFDLNKTASAAAVTALGQDALGTDEIKLEAFTAAGHDRADFPQWEAFFTNHVKNYTMQKATLSPAAKVAAQAASSATAAAATEARAAAAKTATNANTTQTAASTATTAAS